MEFVAYSTENYKILTDIWLESAKTIVPESDIHLKIDPVSNEYGFGNDFYMWCIEQKLHTQLDLEPTKEFVVFSDCDIQFFKGGDWDALLNHIRKSPRQIFFMRDCNREHVNTGFFIVKTEYFKNTYKDFVRKMLEHGICDYYYADQGYINEHRDELDWDFIPDEYIIDKLSDSTYDTDRVCMHHAICAGKTLMDKLSCMHKVKSMIYGKTPDHMKIKGDYELVVAKYKENIAWTKRYANVKVYDKGPRGNTPNIGREAHTYLTYIVENYDRLPGTVYFSQGCISDHGYTEDHFLNPKYDEHILIHEHIMFHKNVIHPREKLTFKEWFRTYIDSTVDLEQPIKIWWGAIFSVSRERIKSRSKEYYQMLLKLVPHTSTPEIAHYFERSWYYIFKEEDICTK